MEGNVSDVQPELSQRLSTAHLEMLRRGCAISDDVIDHRGVCGLATQMETLAAGYQAERPGRRWAT
jgi:hypothetical protein